MKRIHSAFALIVVAIPILTGALRPVAALASGTLPITKQGAGWRIGYLEGGPFTNYQGSLKATALALMQMGWIDPAPLPSLPDSESTEVLWDWLSASVNSRYLEFVEDARWSANWNEEKRRRNALQAVDRLNNRKDIDIMLAMGTWAGQDLALAVKTVPIVVMSCSNAVESGIVASSKDSGKDNVHAWVDPDRFLRRHRLFHDILNFKKLGIIYENSDTGRAYAGLDALQEVARERRFEVIECHAREAGFSAEQSRAEVAGCVARLAPKVDAFTVSDLNGQTHMFFPQLVEPFFEHGVLVYTPVRGPLYVKRGALMGIARMDYEGLGNFYADVIARILNGARPRDLEQEYREPLGLVINLESARRLHYRVPKNLQAVADEVYQEIETDPAE